MQLQLIRNATMRLQYAGRRLLLDPYLADAHTLPSYRGGSKNPLVPLPLPAADVIAEVDFALVSHLHTDHFDGTARRLLPSALPLLCQPADLERLRGYGFDDVRAVDDRLTVDGVTLTRTPGSHGVGEIGRLMGPVSGFVLVADGEPTVYWLGDTILTDEVRATAEIVRPDVIIAHAGGAVWGDPPQLIILDADQTVALCQAQPDATVIAVHLEALDHCLTGRAELRQAAERAQIAAERLRIPADGEWITIER